MPAFLSILLMPVTGSISDGILAGLLAYIILHYLTEMMKYYKKKKHNHTSNSLP
jgi:AGZA family xanthine/uracil permease-like MFS transporter